jgi:Ecdysteroid kinase-like family
MSNVPFTNPRQVTAAALTDILRRAHRIRDAKVEAVSPTRIGNGMVADSFRFSVVYDREEEAAPRTLVGKFPSANEDSRIAARVYNLYLNEILFYQRIVHTVDIACPTAYVAEIDLETLDFCLLMEDLAPAEQGDQLGGCSPGTAAEVLLQAAALHAPRWGDRSLHAQEWLARDPNIRNFIAAYPQLFSVFRERYTGILESRYIAIGEALMRSLPAYYDQHQPPWTIVHNDFRLDNMLFNAKGGQLPMVTLDWQTTAFGPGAADVAYFLGAALRETDREQNEGQLVREYHAALRAGGVSDYSWEQCWNDYRLFALSGYLMAVSAAGSVGRTERGDELFLTMARRHGNQILCLRSLELFV